MMQGDSYNLGIKILNNAGNPVAPEDIRDVEITIGQIRKTYSNAELRYSEGLWMFPVSQNESFGVWPGPVKAQVAVLKLPLKQPTEEELARSRDILEHEADYLGGNMAKTTDLFEARMLLSVAKTDGYAQALVTALRVGGFAAAGSSGEPFCAIGKRIKAESPFEAQFALYFTNGSSGYFPMIDAFSYDGYEARTCKFQPGVGELIADTSLQLLNNIK